MPQKHVMEFDFAIGQVVKFSDGHCGAVRGYFVNSGSIKQYLVHHSNAAGDVREDWCESSDLHAA